MGETHENWVTLQNDWSPHLKYHLQQTKEDAGVGVWDLKGEEGNSHEEGKANVWYTNVCWVMQRRWAVE